ncbi:MAG: ATP-binding protein, partial [Planctomycetota bacterium]
ALAAQNQELQQRGFEVARKNVELLAANRVKDEFLATMSHELRTPLNSVLGFLSLLREGLFADDDEQKTFLDNAHVSAAHLLKLVNDILDFTRMQAGKLTVHNEGIAIPALIDEVLAEFEPAASSKGLKIHRPRNLAAVRTIQADRTRIRQVLSHLIDNALKFTPEGSVTLNVRCDQDDDFVTFEIIDTGIGLEPDFAAHAFEIFRQADGSYTRRYGGLGLGLCVSKKLVELMGGSIQIASDGLGRGTKVSFVIPCVPEEAGLESGTARRAS